MKRIEASKCMDDGSTMSAKFIVPQERVEALLNSLRTLFDDSEIRVTDEDDSIGTDVILAGLHEMTLFKGV